MRYVRSVLTDNERLIYTTKLHWYIYLYPTIALLIALFALGLLNVFNVIHWWYITIPLFVIAGGLYLWAYLTTASTELAITSHRVIAKRGFIWRKTTELKHRQVESLKVDQTIFGRLLNFGDIEIVGTGGTTANFDFIRDPLTFRSKALTQDDRLDE